MKPLRNLLYCVTLLFVCTMSASAQNGCIDSPENPTALLVLVGAAAAVMPTLRARVKRFRTNRNKSRARVETAL
jgi:XrtJ-associated TM-motif-TM protein